MLHRSPIIPHRFSRGGERPGDAQSLAKVLFLLRGTVHGGETRALVRHCPLTQSNGKRKLKLTLSASLLFLSLQDNTSRGCEQSVPSGPIFATAEVWRSPAQVFRTGEPGCCQRGQLLRFRSPLVRVFFKTAILPVPSHMILAERSGASAKTRTRSTRMFHLKIKMCQLKTTS